jgi:hypothetical protein
MFPQRSICVFCEYTLQRDSADEPWGSPKLAGFTGRNPECGKAPTDGEEPMPGHRPGLIITKNGPLA